MFILIQYIFVFVREKQKIMSLVVFRSKVEKVKAGSENKLKVLFIEFTECAWFKSQEEILGSNPNRLRRRMNIYTCDIFTNDYMNVEAINDPTEMV